MDVLLGTGRCAFAGFAIAALLFPVSCVDTTPTDSPPPGATLAGVSLDENGRPVGWAEKTHSRDATADYAVVFPDGKVNRLDITIAPADWQAMQDDMVAKYGEPGAQGGGAGFPGGGNRAELPVPRNPSCGSACRRQ